MEDEVMDELEAVAVEDLAAEVEIYILVLILLTNGINCLQKIKRK
jgi:hypothetical protein